MSINLQIFSYTLDPGANMAINGAGRFFRILEADGDVGVAIDAQPENVMKAGHGFELAEGQRFGRLRIFNRAAGSQTIEIALGLGRFSDSRMAGSVGTKETMPDTFTSGAPVAALNAATTLIGAANSARREAVLVNDGAGTIYIGGAAGAAAGQGLPLAAGQPLTLDTTAAIYARNDSGAAVNVAIAELERS